MWNRVLEAWHSNACLHTMKPCLRNCPCGFPSPPHLSFWFCWLGQDPVRLSLWRCCLSLRRLKSKYIKTLITPPRLFNLCVQALPFQSEMTLICNLQCLKCFYNSTRHILGHMSFGQPPNFTESVFKNVRISQNLSCWPCSRRAEQHIYFSEVGREITISALHFSFRGRHSGKGPAAVSNQSGVGRHRETDDVAQPAPLLANLYFVRKGKLCVANHLIGKKIPFHHFKTGICKMHVI